jgi:hypothetical protein
MRVVSRESAMSASHFSQREGTYVNVCFENSNVSRSSFIISPGTTSIIFKLCV